MKHKNKICVICEREIYYGIKTARFCRPCRAEIRKAQTRLSDACRAFKKAETPEQKQRHFYRMKEAQSLKAYQKYLEWGNKNGVAIKSY